MIGHMRPLEEDVSLLTWSKCIVLSKAIEDLKVKDKRVLFNIMRTQSVSGDTFFPNYGFTAGEFSLWHILVESSRNKKK